MSDKDTVYRQAAIQALDNAAELWNIAEPYHEGIRAGYKNSARLIMSLPSAQPEIIRCKDCKFFVSDMERCEADDEHPASPDAFCSWAERRDG